MTSSNNKMITEFKKIFNCGYFTTENKKLFNDNISIGWFEYNNSLFIINYEYYAKNKTLSLKQAIKYYNIAKETEEFKKYNSCYLIVGYGTKPLKCEIYSTKNKDIKKNLCSFTRLHIFIRLPNFSLPFSENPQRTSHI